MKYDEAKRELLEALATFQQAASAKLADTISLSRIGERQNIAEMKRKATELEIALLTRY